MTVYLDHNATTPALPEVAAFMLDCAGRALGNPSSLHAPGQAARAEVDAARAGIRALAGGPSGDVVFTGSGTEAVQLALLGGARAGPRRRILVSAIEHASALEAARRLAREGWGVGTIPAGEDGTISLGDLERELAGGPAFVSVLHANNETGVIQPVEAVAALCREQGALLHVDAVQSAGKLPVEAEGWGADFVSLAAHKLGGPPGVGALWKRPGVPLEPVVPGSQEGGKRGGTLNVWGIAGFGLAARLASADLRLRAAELEALRRRLEAAVLARLPEARLTGAGSPRLGNTAHFTFPPEVGADLVTALDLEGFAVSSGSACASGSEAPSHVLLAMGIPANRARTAVRVSLGRGNGERDVEAFAEALAGIVSRRRERSPAASPRARP